MDTINQKIEKLIELYDHDKVSRDDLIEKIIDSVKSHYSNHSPADLMTTKNDEELYLEAMRLIASKSEVSTSMLQIKLKTGYAKAAKILHRLESDGYVGPADGARPREVYSNKDTTLERNFKNGNPE